MTIKSMTIIKDALSIGFIVLVLLTRINDWWTVLGILMLSGSYEFKT